ncbi:MAG: DUF4249 domain-containing protein [Bacteroidota bacterium]
MPVNRFHIWILLLLLCGSCVEPFQPVIEETQEVMVIYGVITDQPGIHRVTVSTSTPYNDPSLVPVSGCVVRVEDELGNMSIYAETDPGIYETTLNTPFLATNKSYTLFVNTQGGGEYQSSYDTLLACPPIDSIYYEVDSIGTSDPNVIRYGVQFYSELTGSNDASRNFRWQLEETWRYHSAKMANQFWYGGPLIPVMADSIFTCYMTGPVNGLYSASTRYLSENKLKRNKLAFVSNETPRLRLEYSLLVKQQSLTNEIFNYWDRMESQTSDGGGLYETQPASTIGNIYNVHRPEEKVLGCFYATQQQSKRLTFKSEFDFYVPGFTCELDTAQSVKELGSNRPYYLFSLDPFLAVGPPYLYGSNSCFDCRLKGGTTEKPEYW